MASYDLKLDPHLLSTFLAVCDLRKISAATRVVHLSQPAVTAQIRKLESELNTSLFIRSVRGVQLTADGRKLYEYARKIHSLIDETIHAMSKEAEPSGHITLSASTTIASYVLPRILGSFAQDYPKAHINLNVGNTDEVIKEVKSGKTPLGLVEGLLKVPHLRTELFIRDQIIPIASPLLAERIKRLSDLKETTILWREPGSGTRAVVERNLKLAGIRKSPAPFDRVMGGTEVIKGSVMAGLGVGFVSNWSVQNEIALGWISKVALPDLHIERSFAWALPSGALSGLPRTFYEFAKKKSASIALK